MRKKPRQLLETAAILVALVLCVGCDSLSRKVVVIEPPPARRWSYSVPATEREVVARLIQEYTASAPGRRVYVDRGSAHADNRLIASYEAGPLTYVRAWVDGSRIVIDFCVFNGRAGPDAGLLKALRDAFGERLVPDGPPVKPPAFITSP